MIKEIICNRCYEKCIIQIDKWEDEVEIHGNLCDEGINCAKAEINNRKGVLTTLVRIKGAQTKVVPVKSNKPIEKSLWVECSKALSRLHVGVPIRIGDIVCKNILNTGVDIICTKNMLKEDK